MKYDRETGEFTFKPLPATGRFLSQFPGMDGLNRSSDQAYTPDEQLGILLESMLSLMMDEKIRINGMLFAAVLSEAKDHSYDRTGEERLMDGFESLMRAMGEDDIAENAEMYKELLTFANRGDGGLTDGMDEIVEIIHDLKEQGKQGKRRDSMRSGGWIR